MCEFNTQKPTLIFVFFRAKPLQNVTSRVRYRSSYLSVHQEGYTQKIQHSAHSLKLYGDGKVLHKFDCDGSCATQIPRIRTVCDAVYLYAPTWLRENTHDIHGNRSLFRLLSEVEIRRCIYD